MKIACRRFAGFALGLLAGCSPELDWREVHVQPIGLQAMFPCKPVHRSRPVELAGQVVPFTIDACDAGGATWALAHAETGDALRVGPALAQLRSAAQQHIRSTDMQSTALQVPGMTPQPASQRLSLAGRLPDGSAVRQEIALFARGTVVFQASVVGARPGHEALGSFFDALRFAP